MFLDFRPQTIQNHDLEHKIDHFWNASQRWEKLARSRFAGVYLARGASTPGVYLVCGASTSRISVWGDWNRHTLVSGSSPKTALVENRLHVFGFRTPICNKTTIWNSKSTTFGTPLNFRKCGGGVRLRGGNRRQSGAAGGPVPRFWISDPKM